MRVLVRPSQCIRKQCMHLLLPRRIRTGGGLGVPGRPAADRPRTDLALAGGGATVRQGAGALHLRRGDGEGMERRREEKKEAVLGLAPPRAHGVGIRYPGLFLICCSPAAAPYLHRVFRERTGCRWVWLCGCVAGRPTDAHGAWRRVYLRIRGRQSQECMPVAVYRKSKGG